MKKTAVLLSIALIIGGCMPVPEELSPMLGGWSLVSNESGLNIGYFIFYTYTEVDFDDATYMALWGAEEVGGSVSYHRNLCMLTEDFLDAEYSGSQYKYFAFSKDFVYDADLLDSCWYYFNLTDGIIEGVYEGYSTLLGSYSGTFTGTRN